MAATEVKTVLTADDAASATLAKIKGGFESIDKSVTGVQTRILDFAKQTAAVAIGANLGSIVQGVKGAVTGAFDEANKQQEQMRELSKTVAGMSTAAGRVEDLHRVTAMTTKETWELKRASAGATQTFEDGASTVYKRLSDIAREAGVARGELVAAFTETGKNTTRTNDQLAALIGQVAQASRALSAPVKDIVAGFAEIEKNTISASNPLIDMVKQANLFRGHNEAIAQKLQSMGRQGMLNVMNKALKEMQERAKKMPMTLREMGDQLSDMKGDVLKLVGEPMVAALTPAFRNFQKFIAENRGQIELYARMLGAKVGQWVIAATKHIEEGFKYVVAHADEIKAAIKTGFDYAKSIFSWMLDNKGKLAAGFVASKAISSGGFGAVDAGKSMVDFAKGLSALNASGIGPLAKGSAGAAASMGAFALATVGVTAAVMSFQHYLKETGGYLNPAKGEAKKNLDAQMDALKRMNESYEAFNDQQIAEYEKFKRRALEAAEAIGENTAMLKFQIDAQRQAHDTLAASVDGMTKAKDRAKALPDMDTWAPGNNDAEIKRVWTEQAEVAKLFADSFNAAAKSGNQAALAASVQIVAGSKTLQQALLDTGSSVGLSLEKLAETVGDKADDFGKRLLERAAQEKSSSAKPPPNVMQFNGGQTFNIKQDFRDQDPDRVAVVFQRDLQRVAENRVQARTALPFGG